VKRLNLLFAKVMLCGSIITLGLGVSKTHAQDTKPVKILFLLDGSSSMLDDWQPGKQRFEVAGQLITAIVDSIQRVNPDVQFALRVFGHQYTVQQNNCFDTKLEVPYNRGNLQQIRSRLKYISPRGVSPIAYSLKLTAEENFVQSDRNAYSIILLTDGGESCGGNMCEVINKLLGNKIAFKPYILSLIDNIDLRKEYDCFGKFLAVPKPEDMVPAIKTIIDDNRLMFEKNDGTFAVTKNEPKPIPTPTPVMDTPVKKEIAPEPPAVVSKEVVRLIGYDFKRPLRKIATKKINLSPRTYVPRKPVRVVFTEEVPEVPVPPREKLSSISTVKHTKIRFTKIFVYPEIVPLKKVAKVMKVKFMEEEPAPAPVAVVPKPVPQEPKPTPKPKPAPALPSGSVKQEDAPVKQAETVKSEDTKILVYFTDGKGKYYKAEPKIDFVNVTTGKVAQSNYRFIDKRTGTPDPIKIAPGTYRITRAGSSFRSAVITIEPNTTGRIDVLVSKGSIRFQYKDNPSRPVSEYTARINQSVAGGPLFTQRCDEILEYDPGQYNILINTLPPTTASLPELKFGETTVIDIKENGTLAIGNGFKGVVQLWSLVGGNYEPFYDFRLNGNPADQKLGLLPGSYKVFFFKDGKEQEMKFQIKSNEETSLTL